MSGQAIKVGTLIVGAGLSGLILARRLIDRGQSVIVVEKSRGVGGRLATRRSNTARFDHGAQFYTRQAPLESLHQIWRDKGIVAHWFDLHSKSYFKCSAGMTAIAKDLSLGLDVRLERKVTALVQRDEAWFVGCESGDTFEARRVILTAPLPQSLELLRQNHLTYDPVLEMTDYTKAIVALIELESSNFGFTGPHGYIEHPLNSNLIFSTADQKAKDVSPTAALTVALNPEPSGSLFACPDKDLSDTIFAELHRLDPQFKPKSIQIKKWRYARPLRIYPSPYACVDLNLYLAGDGMGGPSLNGAARSANALGDTLDQLPW